MAEYNTPQAVAERIKEWIGRYGGENTATLLLYEAMNALMGTPAAAVPTDESVCKGSMALGSGCGECARCRAEMADAAAVAADKREVSVLSVALALLVTGGFVTEEKVDEAIQIARDTPGATGLPANDAQPSGNTGPLAPVEELTDAARDVLAERHRQAFHEGYTHDHDDEHVNDEIAALACFYAMPPGARDWDATSTGYGATLGNAILPPDWHTTTGDRRRELVKAGALVVAELERLDRAASKEGASHE